MTRPRRVADGCTVATSRRAAHEPPLRNGTATNQKGRIMVNWEPCRNYEDIIYEKAEGIAKELRR